jgi:hypothetical protein
MPRRCVIPPGRMASGEDRWRGSLRLFRFEMLLQVLQRGFSVLVHRGQAPAPQRPVARRRPDRRRGPAAWREPAQPASDRVSLARMAAPLVVRAAPPRPPTQRCARRRSWRRGWPLCFWHGALCWRVQRGASTIHSGSTSTRARTGCLKAQSGQHGAEELPGEANMMTDAVNDAYAGCRDLPIAPNPAWLAAQR